MEIIKAKMENPEMWYMLLKTFNRPFDIDDDGLKRLKAKNMDTWLDALKFAGRMDEREKALLNNDSKYHEYVSDHLVPSFEEKRQNGKIVQDKVMIEETLCGEPDWYKGRWFYKGEVDENGKACGEGVGVTADCSDRAEKCLYKGMWKDNKPHGIGIMVGDNPR